MSPRGRIPTSPKEDEGQNRYGLSLWTLKSTVQDLELPFGLVGIRWRRSQKLGRVKEETKGRGEWAGAHELSSPLAPLADGLNRVWR